MALKESSLREERLWPSAQKIKAGEGSREEHAELVNTIKPVRPYAQPVPPASDEEVYDALSKDKKPNAFAPRAIPKGTPVAVRLDIPAYEQKNTWVVSVHQPKSDFTAGPVIGYDSVAHIDNPRFGVHPTGALNIASGKPKSTIATVHGNWRSTTPEKAYALAQTIHENPEWRQVGMDPERHSYFYDRETQQPVIAADEALHIGPLVYAKNPVYDKPENYKFADGGAVNEDEDGITAYHGSPHDFEQFDTSKIGTGEGNASYGHGLYFAGNEDVAKWYRDTLSGHHPGDVKIGEEEHPHWAKREIANAFAKLGYDPQTSVMAAHYINEHKGDLGKASGAVWENENVPNTVHEALLAAEYATPAGHMYQVHINAHPHHFLDWDEALEDQSDYIKKALKRVADHDEEITGYTDLHEYLEDSDGYAGKAFYQNLANRGRQKEASEIFNKMGIKGIRYKDAASRTDEANPSYNYVIFDHNNVAVKRKYAHGGEVEEYPLRHHTDWEEAHDYEKTGGELTHMSPDNYLDKVKPLNMDHDDKHIIHHFEKQMENGEKFDPVAIYPDGHPNGRHRAHAAKKLGIDKIPVVTWPKKTAGGSIVDKALMLTSRKA